LSFLVGDLFVVAEAMLVPWLGQGWWEWKCLNFPLECVIWAHKVGWDWNQEQNCGMEFFTEKNNQVVVLVHSILVGPLDILPVSLKSGLDVLYMMLHLPPPLILIF
jgi:hypothetical protein